MKTMIHAMVQMSLAAILLASACGCAAMFNHGGDDLRINSEPQGAYIRHNGVSIGKTPMTVSLKGNIKGAASIYDIELDGHEPGRVVVEYHPGAGWVVLDVVSSLFLLWIPLIVDAASGAWMEPSTGSQAYVVLKPRGGAYPPAAPPSTIIQEVNGPRPPHKKEGDGPGEENTDPAADHAAEQDDEPKNRSPSQREMLRRKGIK
ncbi:MAG: hypothetical protein GMKNLPBB_02872 [Myxococcota bacterium]|nr:hypothetical protein [Myxococcota bacterium]